MDRSVLRARETNALEPAIGLGGLTGLLLVLATAAIGVGWLGFVALAPLLAVSLGAWRVRSAAAAGLVAGLVFYGVGFSWVPRMYGGGAVMLAAWALSVPLLASSLAAWSAGLAWLRRRWGAGIAAAAAPAAWMALELLRSSGPLGIPWLHLGHAVAEHPALAQLAALGGVHLLSGWLAAVGATVVMALRTRQRALRWAPAAVFAPGLVFGLVSLSAADATDRAELRVAAVQPNLAPERRHVRARFDANLRQLLALSERASEDGADVVVWPESAWEQPLTPGSALFLGSIAKTLGTPLLSGAREPLGAGVRRNAAVLADTDGAASLVGEKARPLPLYERAPESDWERALAARGWWPGRVRPAARPSVATLRTRHGEPVPVGLLICADAAHPELARTLRHSGARVLVGLANEAETGAWSARQHAVLVRLRAIETRAPFVRVANTGPSVWIDAYGRERARLDGRAAAAASASVRLAEAPPPFVDWGHGPFLAAACATPLLAARRRRSRIPLCPPSAVGSPIPKLGDRHV
ncbi:MAG: apolipoprotein N-acyltransferase [Myxococcota bacterium]|nr:apolipoprotein N-acyltransferase [Myxococcota bacterium]